MIIHSVQAGYNAASPPPAAACSTHGCSSWAPSLHSQAESSSSPIQAFPFHFHCRLHLACIYFNEIMGETEDRRRLDFLHYHDSISVFSSDLPRSAILSMFYATTPY